MSKLRNVGQTWPSRVGRGGRDVGRQVGVAPSLVAVDGVQLHLGDRADEFAIVAVGQSGARGGVPEIQGVGFRNVTGPLAVGDEADEVTFNVIRRNRQVESRGNTLTRREVWQAVETFVVVGA